MPPTDILIVDDDPSLREVVRYALSREGYDVREAADGVAGLRACQQQAPDLIVLDLLMPEMGGLEMCRRLRADSNVPIVFLSTRGDEIDRVVGLEMGGDDYLPKPFSTRELVSRVKAVLRRGQATEPTIATTELVVGALRLDLDAHRCFAGDTELNLTLTEFRLLHVLMGRPGRAYTRDELTDRAYPGNHHVSGRTVDSHIRRIRAKLREGGVELLETVHGLGYRLNRP